MLTVEGRRHAHPGITLPNQHEAMGGVDQNAVREVGADMKQSERCERVDRVLLAAEHGQVELADDRVAEFMSEREQSVAGHELDDPLLLLLVKASDRSMSQSKRAAGLLDPRADAVLRASWVPRRSHERAGHEHAAEKGLKPRLV